MSALLSKAAVILYTLAALGVLGVFVYTQIIYERPLPSERESMADLMREASQSDRLQTFPIDRMVVNLPGKTSRLRYLEVEPHLKTLRAQDAQILDAERTLIRDIFITTAAEIEPHELNTLTGKILFENRLKKRINQLLGRPVVKKIYFTHFVVQ